MEGNMSDSHKPLLDADASRVHLCDCNRSFALDAARLAPASCHHALCGAELPALEAALAAGGDVYAQTAVRAASRSSARSIRTSRNSTTA